MNSQLKSLESEYLKGNLQAFIDHLLSIKTEIPRDIFHYNLGTVQAKLGLLGPARYNLEMAKNFGMKSEILTNNINYVVSKIEQQPLASSANFFDSILIFIKEINIQYFYISILVISAIFLILYLNGKVRNWKRLIISLLVFFAIIPAKILINHTYTTGVLLSEAKLHEGPSAIFKEVGDIPEGYKVMVKNIKDGWALVIYPSYKFGWINLEKIGITEI